MFSDALKKMDEHCKLGELKRKKSGQLKCQNCQKSYNNASTPQYCSNDLCKKWLGGKFVPKPSQPTAFLLNDKLASVRIREKGRNIRAFVSIGAQKKVRLLIVQLISLTSTNQKALTQGINITTCILCKE